MQLLENQRIKHLINFFVDGSQIKFATKLGITQQTLGNYINGKTKVPLYVAEKIKEHYPTVNLEWLVMGVGDMLLKNEGSLNFLKEQDVNYLKKQHGNLTNNKNNGAIVNSEVGTIKTENSEIALLRNELENTKKLLSEKDSRIHDLLGQIEFLKKLLEK